MANKQYLNAFMNNSATIRDVAGADITNAPHKAVSYNSEGKLALPAADGTPAIGIVLSDVSAYESGDSLVTKAGTEIDVLIRHIGLIEVGEAITKGDLLTVNTTGQAKKAATGDYILGIAMTAADAAGQLVQMNITHSGYSK